MYIHLFICLFVCLFVCLFILGTSGTWHGPFLGTAVLVPGTHAWATSPRSPRNCGRRPGEEPVWRRKRGPGVFLRSPLVAMATGSWFIFIFFRKSKMMLDCFFLVGGWKPFFWYKIWPYNILFLSLKLPSRPAPWAKPPPGKVVPEPVPEPVRRQQASSFVQFYKSWWHVFFFFFFFF